MPLSKIKPDPNQPRKHIAKEDVEALAASIRKTGLLKNIEVDPKGFIVTGELRLRAARVAGMKEIPVRIVDVSGGERSRRQLIENIHVYPMTPMETAEALKKLQTQNKEMSDVGQGGLARELGKGKDWGGYHLKLLEMPKSTQKAIQAKKFSVRLIPGISGLSQMENEGDLRQGTVDKLVKKVISKEFPNRGTAEQVIRAIRDNPGTATQYLKPSYKGKDEAAVQRTLDKIAPTRDSQIADYRIAIDSMITFAKRLTRELRQYPFDDLGLGRTNLLSDLQSLKEEMKKWHSSLK